MDPRRHDSRDSIGGGVAAALDRLPIDLDERDMTESHAVLWSVVLVSAVFDILTTLVGLARGLEEGNVVARAFIETYGTPGLGGLKFAALVLLVVAWGLLSDRRATVVLAGFAVVSLFVVAANAATLAGL